MTSNYEAYFDAFKEVRSSLVLQQEVIQTFDGAILRNKTEQKALHFINFEYSSRPYISQDQPFVTVRIKLSDSILRVQRTYPTILNTISDIGRLFRVLSFLVFAIISVHHEIVLEQYVLNEAILKNQNILQIEDVKKDNNLKTLDERIKYHTSPFSYFEIVKMKFLSCSGKKCLRAKQYTNLKKIVADALEISQVMANSCNLQTISDALLQPYQKRIISQFQISRHPTAQKVAKLGIEASIQELTKRIGMRQGDLLSQRIDQLLHQFIAESQTQETPNILQEDRDD